MSTTPGTPLRYRKKPVMIEARQWDGTEESQREIAAWVDAWAEGSIDTEFDGVGIVVYTLEGKMLAAPGDWIIRGIKGEFYPCKPDIFEATYEVAEGAGPTVPELLEVLEGVVDCAIWLTGLGEIPPDSAWPEMSEKLHRALPYVKDTIESDGEIVGFVP